MEKTKHTHIPEAVLAFIALAMRLISEFITVYASGGTGKNTVIQVVAAIIMIAVNSLLAAFFITGRSALLKSSLGIKLIVMIATAAINMDYLFKAGYSDALSLNAVNILSFALLLMITVGAFVQNHFGKNLMRGCSVVLLALDAASLLSSFSLIFNFNLSYGVYLSASMLEGVFFYAAIAVYAFGGIRMRRKIGLKEAEERFAELKYKLEKGEITDAEYAAERTKILESM